MNLIDQRVWSITPHFVSYTVSKAGLWALTQSMALALAPRIRVNGIGPGPALASTRQSPEQFARQASSVPLGHGTDPDEVSRAVLAILTLPSLTGQMLALDGGQHLQWSPGRSFRAANRGVVLMDAPRIADATRGLRHVFLRDMVLEARIGVHAHEHRASQRVRINVDLGVVDEGARAAARDGIPALSRASVGRDELSRVVDYEQLANAVRAIVTGGHVRLVETLAERIAEACLTDPRVEVTRVRVEKLDVFPDAASAGVEIERLRR